jgi:hypothetical protein
MRMLLKASMDTEKSNQALQEGRMQSALEGMMRELQPEATYFYPENGRRTALFVFDMEDPSQLPGVSEPLFSTAGADVHVTPVMNAEDLQKGLQQAFG